MVSDNKNNKSFPISQEDLSKGKRNDNPGLFWVIIVGIFGSTLIVGILFQLYMIPEVAKFYSSDCILNAKRHMVFPFIVGLGIGISISIGVWKSRYTNRKTLLGLAILFIFFIYLFYSIAGFINDTPRNQEILSLPNFLMYLSYSVYDNPLKFEYCSGIRDEDPINRKMYEYTNKIRRIFYIITFGKINPYYDLPKIINFQIWIIEFIVTFFIAWLIISFTCSRIVGDERIGWLIYILKNYLVGWIKR